MKARSNVHDVAKKANVSAMTVTRVFNNPERVAEKTRNHVLAISKELNYRPSRSARILRQGYSNSIGLLWSLGGPHDSADVVRRMTQALTQKKYISYLVDTLGDPAEIRKCLIDLIERKVDGVIVQSPPESHSMDEFNDLFAEIKSVVVVSDNPAPDVLTCDYLHRDLICAIDESLSYFYETGRRNIVLLASLKKKFSDIRERLSGRPYMKYLTFLYVDALEKKRKSNDFQIYVDELEQFLESGNCCDAVWGSSDEIIAASIQMLEKKGFHVPKDIALCGVNNTAICKYTKPQIASVERKNEIVAKTATDMLLNRIENKDLEFQHNIIKMELIKRESIGVL